ncbi:hypothetical protein DL89DRAFT_294220 [Linderina pennispora]|uniref:SHSP domain-containing protein n=1 Tax=Linderina pennispora TaxID=61395 RepID=A0A1Y1W4Q6_9FUNG|nr:uncharacterized protein DL89DRAFT_294220 [Linderina pennispora]ORX68325.1 hypothetical protein DL89DRAFT_294220 [Linderina pennispora]
MSSSAENGYDDLVLKAGTDMGTLFDGFFGSIEGLRAGQPSDKGLWAPRIDRHEDEDQVVLRAHLPNVPHNHIRIDRSTPGRLKIFGEYNSQTKRLGQFEKDVPLPPAANSSRFPK